MKTRLRMLAINTLLIGIGTGFGAITAFDELVERRARRLLANPIWEAERITRDATKEIS